MTQQTKLRLLMAGLVACAAAVAALWTLAAFGPQVRANFSAIGFVALAMIGGAASGGLVGPYLGRSGWVGLMLSLGAFFAATVIGAAVAGLLGLRAERAVDLVSLWLAMHFLTPAVAFWLVLWGGVQLSARVLRRSLI